MRSYTMSRVGITNDISYIQIWKLFQHTANDNLIIIWCDTLEDVKAFIHMGSIVNIHGQQRKPQERSTTLQVTVWYRRILKIHWAETIINAELWQQTNQEPHEIKRSRWVYWPHALETDIQHYKTGPNMESTGQEDEEKALECLEARFHSWYWEHRALLWKADDQWLEAL